MTTKTKGNASKSKPQAGALKIASAKELQAQAVAALTSAGKLTTEKQGRLYAIAMLQGTTRELEREGTAFSSYSGRSEENDDEAIKAVGIWRKGPQYDGYKIAFDHLYANATPAALCGFFAVFTDYIGAALFGGGVLDVERLPASERRGDYEPWGTVNYRDPKAAARAIAKGKNEYRIKPKRAK